MHPKITEAITMFNYQFLSLEQSAASLEFYMFFLNHVSFWEAEIPEMPTMAATIYRNRLAVLWVDEFVESLTQKELMGVLIHEAMHLLSNHIQRGKGYDREVSNIAMDMIINELLIKYHGNYICLPILTQERLDQDLERYKSKGIEITSEDLTKMQKRVGKTYCIEMDQNYKGDKVYESLYNWLMTEYQKEKQGKPNELSEDTKQLMKNAEYRKGMTLDYHGELTEVEDQIRKSLADNAREKAKYDYERSRHKLPGDITDILDLLLKAPKNNNLKQLKRMISSLKGREKMKTYSRLNRRVEGVKGSKKQSLAVNAILDVSGSMGNDFEVALTELFHGGYTINLIQCDTQVNRVEVITNKNQLNRLKISGLGGTIIQPAVDYVMDPKNKMSKYPTVILSDAFTDTLDFKGAMNQWLLLSTTKTHIPYTNGRNVRSLIIEQ